MKTLNIKIKGYNNDLITEKCLLSMYSSNLRLEPVKRLSEIKSDGTVDIMVPDKPVALHAMMPVPDYGHIWVIADNCGEGYKVSVNKAIDFVEEAAKSHLKKADDVMRNGVFSVQCKTHRDAAHDFLKMAYNSDKSGRYNLRALSHALWAGELAVVESARQKIGNMPKKEGFLFGCKTQSFFGSDMKNYDYERIPDEKYFTQIANMGSLPFYLRWLEPEEGKPRYDYIDKLVEWCVKNGLRAKGHPLWWGNIGGIPAWLEGASWEKIQYHAARVVERSVKRYKGAIDIWDVVNEAHDWANGLFLTQEQEIEITRICCEAARCADPDATLIVNNCCPFGEYAAAGQVSSSTRGPDYSNIARFTPLPYLEALEEAGVKYDVIGLQLYFPVRDMLSINRLLDEYARFGKPIHITELGVRSHAENLAVPHHGNSLSEEQVKNTTGDWHFQWCEKIQADWMEWFYTMAYARDEIKAITWWDSIDPAFIPSSGLLHEDRTPKEIFYRLRTLRQEI